MHTSGWFRYASSNPSERTPGATEYHDCVMLTDLDQDALPRSSNAGMLSALVASYEHSLVLRGTSLALIVEEPGRHLYGWDHGDALLLDVFY